MTYKWDATITEKYTEQLAQKICEENYFDNDVLDGPQLLELTPSKQVNLFVLRELYGKWKIEMTKIESPYFDFKHPEVQSALAEFMNFISEFIAVRQKELEPLLKKALSDTFKLGFHPKTFFDESIQELPNYRVTKEWLIDNKKYFILNKGLLKSLLDACSNKIAITSADALEIVEVYFSKTDKDNIEETIAAFASIIPTPEGLIVKEETEPTTTNKPSRSFFDSIIEDKLVEKIRPIAVNGSNGSASVAVADAPKVIEAVIAQEKTETKRINEQHDKGTKSINDKATSAEVVTDYHRLSKIDSIRKTISINQKFLFINNLFGGNIEAFNNSLNEFDALDSYDEALKIVEKRYAPHYLWDLGSAEVEEFVDILKRRFN